MGNVRSRLSLVVWLWSWPDLNVGEPWNYDEQVTLWNVFQHVKSLETEKGKLYTNEEIVELAQTDYIWVSRSKKEILSQINVILDGK